MDHWGALPYFLAKTKFYSGGGKIYMTSPTKPCYKNAVKDSLKVKKEGYK